LRFLRTLNDNRQTLTARSAIERLERNPDMSDPLIAAVILAAGRSSRMGRPKAMLTHRDGVTSFVSHAITQAKTAGAEIVLVVGRGGDLLLEREVAAGGARFVTNSQPDQGQLSSLLAALDVLGNAEPAVEAVVVVPVDVPLLSADVIRTTIAAARATAAPIVRAVHRGVHGHPVLFKRVLFGELHAADTALGAKAVVRADPTRVVDVEVNDGGILMDVDTPADYERLFGRRPGRKTGLRRA
jgi:molybdenum cofactor cytidylyltransferase